MYGSLEDFPLRQIKFVRTRNSVLKATTNLLKEKTFDEITVDEICLKSQISRGTFFNYFPQKSHIFYYYMRIFTIKIMQRIRHWDKDMRFREQMEHIYTWFDEESQYPNFVKSYIYYLLEDGSSQNTMKLTEAEFVYFFTGIEDDYQYYNNITITGIIKDLCMTAKEKGELPFNIDDDKLAKVFLAFLVGPFITHKGLEGNVNPRELFDVILDGFL
ncbi:MAG TPA: TetR/AcrR family transcriptional regulator [Epulopiscium sp.]|nr:TetR/AcrR family transcriptional regulator [Candidatus Epulonipiscium sp.]